MGESALRMRTIKMHFISIDFISEVNSENGSVAGCLPRFPAPTNKLIHKTPGLSPSAVLPVPFRDDHRWSQNARSFL